MTGCAPLVIGELKCLNLVDSTSFPLFPPLRVGDATLPVKQRAGHLEKYAEEAASERQTPLSRRAVERFI